MIRVNFKHRTLTPGNIRMTWHVDAAKVPAIGDEIQAHWALAGAGPVVWTVAKRRWIYPVKADADGPICVEITMVGPTPLDGRT